MEAKNIQEEARQFVFNLLREKLSHDHVYHNYNHTLKTVEASLRLAKSYDLQGEQLENLLLAGWFHDTGYTEIYKGHEEKSKEIAKKFLKEYKISAERIDSILDCIEGTKRSGKPSSLIGEILSDADIISVGQADFFATSDLLREEWERFKIGVCSEREWAKIQEQFLNNTQFYTQAAQEIHGEQLILNRHKQANKRKKLEKKKEKKQKKLDKSNAQPKRGIETMFRSIYNSHINLSSIADSKANMMINIHALLISVTIGLVGAKLSLFGASFKQNQIMIYPIISLLLTSLISIIFAILSAKPQVTESITSLDELKQKNASIIFFGNFTHLKLSEFEEQVRELMKNEEQLYGNMIRDIYHLGKVLIIKYRLLRYSYIAFMWGLIATVFMIIFVIVYLKKTDGI